MNKILKAIYLKNSQYDNMNETSRTLIFFGSMVGVLFLIAIGSIIEIITDIKWFSIASYGMTIFLMVTAAIFRIPYMQGHLNKYRPVQKKQTKNSYKSVDPLAWKIPHLHTLGLYNNLASQDEIKKAFRKMAMRYHPDRCKDPRASIYFNNVRKAYESLTI